MAKISVESEERLRKGKIAHEILRVLKDHSLQVPLFRRSNLGEAFLPKLESRGIGRKRKNSIRVAVNRLRRQRFIEYTASDERNVIKLTTSGERRIRQYDFERLELQAVARWDGIWRIVMFDIPEEMKRARDAITRKLKSIGFQQLQKSVFIHYLHCADEIDFIKEFFELKDEVTYIEATNIGSSEDTVRRRFKMK